MTFSDLAAQCSLLFPMTDLPTVVTGSLGFRRAAVMYVGVKSVNSV